MANTSKDVDGNMDLDLHQLHLQLDKASHAIQMRVLLPLAGAVFPTGLHKTIVSLLSSRMLNLLEDVNCKKLALLLKHRSQSIKTLGDRSL
jgi:hypothetical protein